MKRGVVLGVDQGTSSSRCLVLDAELRPLALAAREVGVSHPRAGWVEQDPEELFRTAQQAIGEALALGGVEWDSVLAIGIANQTETSVVWDLDSGAPIYPAIVWQCRRTADRCQQLRAEGHAREVRARTGLELDPTFPASKIAWILDEVPGARQAAADGRLAYGDVASWLIWRLSGGRAHVTDPSNASRSMLVDLSSLEWDADLLDLFDVPAAVLPRIHRSGPLAETTEETVGACVPIGAAIGDQQAALFGQQCWSKGDTKLTLGTGAFLWANAGSRPPDPPEGILASCCWSLADDTVYGMEGFVPTAGAAVAWLVQAGLLGGPAESEEVVSRLTDDEDVWFVPALAGLGAPSWDARARGALLGLTRSTTAGHVVRAALDGVIHQVVDALEAMDPAVGAPRLLRVDGGIAGNDWMMQRLADLSDRPVERPVLQEATAIGAAALAGLNAGLWDSRDELAGRWKIDRRFEPEVDPGSRQRLRQRWAETVEVARSFG